jgi:hypothetical protein
MLKLRQAIVSLAVCIASLPVPASMAQQNSTPAPKPEQILAAKKAFVSNAAEQCANFFCGAPDEPYSDFYNGIKMSARYELVMVPADADLVFEIHFISYRPNQLPHLKLVILDPKTRITLWTLDEEVGTAARQSTARKNFEKAMSSLIRDVQMLSLPAAVPPPNKGS